MRFDFEHCMEHDCKFCKKQIKCERGESNGKRKEFKADSRQQKSKRATRKISKKTKREYSKKENT